MADKAESRRMLLLETLAETNEKEDAYELTTLANILKCDIRTVRRDLDYMQRLLQRVNGIEVRRSKVMVARSGYSPGYFTHQLDRNRVIKEAIARAVVRELQDEQAVALTAGSTPYAVAQEMRRCAVEGYPPHNLIVFTNSVPSLLELIAAGISTGILGDIYSPEDCAFHSPEFHSAFQPGVAIVGTSGIVVGSHTQNGTIELYSHRAEEAAFLKQLLANVPEIIIASDHSKIGRRHPWSFSSSVLSGKRIRLFTDHLTSEQQDDMQEQVSRMARVGTEFSFEVVSLEYSEDREYTEAVVSGDVINER